jgi:hypothetical protein
MGTDVNTNNTQQQKDTNIGTPNPNELQSFIFGSDTSPSITAADLLEKNLDTALRELQHSKANSREMATQLWDLRRQLGDARKYFDKTLHQYEEESNFNVQHLRRSYEEQMDQLKAETKRANRLLEQALNRHSTAHPHSSPVTPHSTPISHPALPASHSSSAQSHPTSPPPATPPPMSPTPSPVPSHPTDSPTTLHTPQPP